MSVRHTYAFYFTFQEKVISTDGDKTIRDGLISFIRQEEEISSSKKRRHELIMSFSGSQRPEGKNIDLPILVYMLQKEYNQQKESEVASDTEVVRKIN